MTGTCAVCGDMLKRTASGHTVHANRNRDGHQPRADRMTTLDPAPDHCTCPMDTPCRCGFAAMMSAIFFGDDS